MLVSSPYMQVGQWIPLQWDYLFNSQRIPRVRLKLMRYCHGFAFCSSSFNVAVSNEFFSVIACKPGLPMPSHKSHTIPISRSEEQIASLSDDCSIYISHHYPTLMMINWLHSCTALRSFWKPTVCRPCCLHCWGLASCGGITVLLMAHTGPRHTALLFIFLGDASIFTSNKWPQHKTFWCCVWRLQVMHLAVCR